MILFKSIKRALRSGARRAGYDVVRFGPLQNEWNAQRRLLSDVPSPLIFDVGANEGQTLRRYGRLFPGAQIHCFEPNPKPFRELERTSRSIAQAELHGVALSDARGTARFHTHPRFTHEGSLFQRPVSRKSYFNSAFELTEELQVETTTVDHFCSERHLDRIHLLKLDVQGNELRVLLGSERMLTERRIDLVFVETSFVEIYEAAPLFHQVEELLRQHDFSLYSLFNLFYARDGQLRYCDALFVSSDLRSRVIDVMPS